MLIVLGTIAIVAAAVGIGLVLEKKIGFIVGPKDLETEAQRKRKQLVSHAAGEAPATALRVRDVQIAKLRTTQRCASCRGAMAGADDDTVHYDGRELLVMHFTCAACGTTRALYIDRVT